MKRLLCPAVFAVTVLLFSGLARAESADDIQKRLMLYAGEVQSILTGGKAMHDSLLAQDKQLRATIKSLDERPKSEHVAISKRIKELSYDCNIRLNQLISNMRRLEAKSSNALIDCRKLAQAGGECDPSFPQFELNRAKDAIGKYSKDINRNSGYINSANGYISKLQKGGPTAQPKTPANAKTPPTVRIVNSSSIPICLHPGGQSGGFCIAPGKDASFKLDTLKATDTDSGRKYNTKQIVIIGGGVWKVVEGTNYTSYQGMTLCRDHTFEHTNGEALLTITTQGLDKNCSVRGYHQ